MRAEKEGRHVSGAERLVAEPTAIYKVVKEFLKRPKEYDKMFITVEKLQEVERVHRALTIYSYDFENVETAHKFAVEKLKEGGISEEVAWHAIHLLREGANPKGGNMRGAVLMDFQKGERLEPDRERGIRTVRMDWLDRESIKKQLLRRGIKRHYVERLLDALVLATKNLYCGVLAELCWSDDPDYTTGYVAGKGIGYVRIKPMKELGVPIGGRVYFVRREGIQELIECLEKKPLLVEKL